MSEKRALADAIARELSCNLRSGRQKCGECRKIVVMKNTAHTPTHAKFGGGRDQEILVKAFEAFEAFEAAGEPL